MKVYDISKNYKKKNYGETIAPIIGGIMLFIGLISLVDKTLTTMSIIFIIIGAIGIFYGTRNSYFRVKHKIDKIKYCNSEVEKLLDNTTLNKEIIIKDWFEKTNREPIKSQKIFYSDTSLAFIDYDNLKLLTVEREELNNFEIYENGGQISFGNSVGISDGLFSAASYRGQSISTCSDLKLIIKFNDYELPHIIYTLIDKKLKGQSLFKNAPIYGEIIESLQRVSSFLDAMNNKDTQKKSKAKKTQ